MAVSIVHAKTLTQPDSADTSIVRPSEWNSNHVIVGLGDAAERNVGTSSSNLLQRSDADTLYAAYSAAGYVETTDNRLAPQQYVQVAKNAPIVAGEWYQSIKAACDYVATQSPATGSRWVIFVHPGEYTEDPFTVPAYTYLTGTEDWGGANIKTSNNAADFISLAANSGIMRFRVTGPTGVGYRAVYVETTTASSATAKAYWINVQAGYYAFAASGTSTGTARLHMIGCVTESTTTTHTFARATGRSNIMMMECGPMTGSGMTYGAYADGANASLTLDLCQFRTSGHTSVYVDNGASAKGISCTFAQGLTALSQGSNGGTIVMHGSVVKTGGYTNDAIIAGSTGSFTFSGAMTKSKITRTGSVVPIIVFADASASTPGQYIYGELMIGSVTSQTPLTSWLNANRATGVISGGGVSRVSGLDVSVAAGSGFFDTAAGQIIVSWGSSTVTLPAASEEVWVQVDSSGVLSAVTVEPDFEQVIVLATGSTNGTDVMFLANQQVYLPHNPESLHAYLTHVIGAAVTDGMAVTKNASPSLSLDVAAGEYFLGLQKKTTTSAVNVSFTYWYRDGLGGWTSATAANVDSANYDNGSGTLAAVPAGKFKRDLMFVAQSDSGDEYHMIYGQDLFNSAVEAKTNPIAPDFILEYAARLAGIIVESGASDIAAVEEDHARIGQFVPPEQSTDKFNIIAAGTQTAQTAGTVSFANSNGVSFGLSGSSQITASVERQTQTHTLSGNYVGNSTVSNASGMVLEGGANVTLSGTGNTIYISAPNPGAGGNFSAGVSSLGNSAGATGLTGTQLVLVGGANITLSQTTGANGATVSVIGGAGAAAAAIKGSGTYTQNTGTIEFSNANGLTFGLSNNGVMTASHDGLTSQSVQTQNMVSVQGSTGAVSFGNANNVTFGGNASTITASIPAGATATGNVGGVAAAGGTATSGTVVFSNSNGVSFGFNNQTVTAAVPSGATATGNLGSVVVEGQTATFTSGAVTFSGAGIVNVSTQTGQRVVISASQSVQTQGSVQVNGSTGAVSVAGTGATTAGNNIGLSVTQGTNGLNLSATVAAQTVQPVAYSAANGSANFSTLTFANSNGVSFSTGTQGVYATVKTDYLTTAAQVSHSHGNPTLNLTNISGTTASASNGLTLSLSGVAAQTTQTQPAGNIAGVGTTFNGANVSGSITLNSNGLNLSLSAGGGVQSNQTLGMYADGNTAGQSSSSTFDARTFSIYGSGAATVGYSNGSLVINAPNAAAGNVTFSAGTTNNGLPNVSFGNANGVSFGLNGSTITASVGAGAVPVLTEWNNAGFFIGSMNNITNLTATGVTRRPMFFPIYIPGNISWNNAAFEFSKVTSNQHYEFTAQFGIYSFANSTSLNLIGSVQNVYSVNSTGSALSGVRRLLMTGATGNMTGLTPGHYVAAYYASEGTGGTANFNASIRGQVTAVPLVGIIAGGSNNTTNNASNVQLMAKFQGLWNATTAGLPSAVALSSIQQGTSGGIPFLQLETR